MEFDRSSRRRLLQVAVGAVVGVPQGVPAAVPGRQLSPPWALDGKILRTQESVPEDRCWIPVHPEWRDFDTLEATLKVSGAGFAAVVLNSHSAWGQRYVLGIEPARGLLRILELPWPGRDWYSLRAPPKPGNAHTLRIKLNQTQDRSTLQVSVDEGPVRDYDLPLPLRAFYAPGLMANSALAECSSLRASVASRRSGAFQQTIPVVDGAVGGDEGDQVFARGHEAFGRWLRSEVEAIRAEHTLPALACAVVVDRDIVAAAVTGVRKLGTNTPVGLNDQFHLGSNSKSVTSTVVGLLVDQGRLHWDDPLEKLLPDLASGMHRDYRGMPLWQFLHMSSGISDGKGAAYDSRAGSLATMRLKAVAETLRVEPTFAGGSRHEYRNANYVVVGAVIDRAARMPWESAIRKLLFDPLGATTVGVGPMGLPGLTLQPYGHTVKGTDKTPIWGDNPVSLAPAGGLHMSVLDFARYARLHLQAEMGAPTLLRLQTFKELHQPRLGYGKGWAVGGPDGAGRYDLSHGGSNTMNSADQFIRPGRGVAVVVMNNESPYGEGLGQKAIVAVHDRILVAGIRQWFRR